MSVEQDTRSRPDDASVQAELAKVLASNVFSRSKRMGRFLRLVVNRSGTEATALKEYEIAVEVYDRPASFDTRPDPIVRVEARRLRQKLTEYYATAGREDSIMIELPKGGYVPEIRFRNRAEPAWNPIRRFEADSRSVAVLPFLNLGGDSDKGLFC